MLTTLPSIQAVRRCAALVCLCFGLFSPSVVWAEASADATLTRLRTWTVDEHEIGRAIPDGTALHRLRLEMAFVSGVKWQPEPILDAVRRSAAILAQCGIELTRVELYE